MNEYPEETHYQLALTNRQVLTAFVILLLCLFVAFFAGVWIGRGEGTGSAPTTVALASDNPTDETFRFFGRSNDAEPAPGSHPASDDPPDDDADQAPPPQVMRAGEPAPLQPLDRTATDRGTSSGTSNGTAKVEAAEPAARSSAPAAAAASPSADTNRSGILVQVSSGTNKTQAQALVTRLESGGHDAFISQIEVKGRAHYRVRVGPFANRAEAESQAKSLEKDFGLDTWIMTAP